MSELEVRNSSLLTSEWRRREEERQIEVKNKVLEVEQLAEDLKSALK